MHVESSYCFCGVQWLRVSQSNGLDASLSETGTRAASETCVCKKLGNGQSPKIADCVSHLPFYLAVFSLLDFLALEAGTNKLSQNVGVVLPLHTL